AAPGLAGALRVRHEELLVERRPLAGRSHSVVEPDHAARRGIALGDQRAPLQDLLDVLERDDARAHLTGPTNANPRQRADNAVARLAALGLAVVRAVGRHVEQ